MTIFIQAHVFAVHCVVVFVFLVHGETNLTINLHFSAAALLDVCAIYSISLPFLFLRVPCVMFRFISWFYLSDFCSSYARVAYAKQLY